MSKRLEILVALTKHLEGIIPANGYQHNLAGRVFRGRNRFGANQATQLPMLSILESKAPDFGLPANEENTVRFDDWILLVQGWARDDVINPTDPAYHLASEVEQRLAMLVAKDDNGVPLYKGVYRLGDKIAKLVLAQPIVRPAEEGLSDTSFFFLPIRVGIKTDLRNP